MDRRLHYLNWQRITEIVLTHNFKPHYTVWQDIPSVFYFDAIAHKMRVCRAVEFSHYRYTNVIYNAYGINLE